MKKPIILLSAMLVPCMAHAYGCDKPRNAYDALYCSDVLLVQTDHDLNQAYARLRSHLNTEQQNTLKQGQLAWIEARDQQCSRQNDTGQTMNPDCAVGMMKQRLEFLQERERECMSSGCVSVKLGD